MHHAAEIGDTTGLNDEQSAQVKECMEYVEGIKDCADEVHKELRLDCDGLTWGTADVVSINGDQGHVIDYKFGRVSVDAAETNVQGWAYALGVFTMFPVMRVTVHFLQPRNDEVTRHTFTREEIPTMRTRVAAIIARAELDNPPTNPDPKACQYCARKATCPALTEKALMIPVNNHWDLPAELNPGAITDPKQLSKVLALLPLIESWASEVKAVALQRAREGQQIPGYTLRSRSGKRVIKDLLPAWSILQDEFGLELHEFLPACSVSIGTLEDAVKQKAQKGGGAAALRQLNSRFAQEGIVTTTAEVEFLAKERN